MKRRRRKITLYTEPCRRGCGQMLTTLSHSIHGADELKRKFELICGECLTPEEHQEILNGHAAAILGRAI